MPDSPRSVQVVLTLALQELQQRRSRMETYQLKIQADLEQTARAISGLEELIDNCGGAMQQELHPLKPEPVNSSPLPTPLIHHNKAYGEPKSSGFKRGEMIIKVIEALRTSAPMTKTEIALAIGTVSTNKGLAICIGQAVTKGELWCENGLYSISETVNGNENGHQGLLQTD